MGRRRCIPVSELARKLAEALCADLPMCARYNYNGDYVGEEPDVAAIAALLDRAGLAEELERLQVEAQDNLESTIPTGGDYVCGECCTQHHDRCEGTAQERCDCFTCLRQRADCYRAALELPLLFHGGGPWDDAKRLRWVELTGNREATTKVLCDAIREALRDERFCDEDIEG